LTSQKRGDTPAPFAVKDCALIAIATGKRAWTLRELRDILENIAPDSIYYHFWGGLLEPRFEEREYNNDFAAWARHGLHDTVLAERLAMVDPTAHPVLETLQQELLELIEARLEESEYIAWSRATRSFEFIRSQIVVFDTSRRLAHPEELLDLVAEFSPTSIFYHFIDARRRLPDATDDLRFWLDGFGEPYADLRRQLGQVDPFFGPLSDLRQELVTLFQDAFEGGAA